MLKLRCRKFHRTILNRAALLAPKSRSYETTERGTASSLQLLRSLRKRHVTTVSTTRGVPSTSVDLKEAVCEKIPLHYDLLRKFRSHYGSSIISQITVDDIYNGLKDVRTGVRETSENDSRHELRYRGLTIPEVLGLLPRRGKAPSPEAVFWLLLTGDVPTHEQTASLVADWSLRRQRRKYWWLECGDGYFVGKVIQALPKKVGPLGRLSVALNALERPEGYAVKTTGSSTMNYSHWEETYEEGMEFLAILPAIVGLVRTGEKIKVHPKEDDDWVDFFLHCSEASAYTIDDKKVSLGDFLRLYIAANADEDGGTPSAHVTQILGASRTELSKAVASSVPAYFEEPPTGTMLQCMDFQLKIRNALGEEPKEEALRDVIGKFYERDKKFVGHKKAEFCDPRYTTLSDFANEHLAEDPQIKLSREISRVLTLTTRSSNGMKLWPEQSTLAAPIFRSYGLKDMEFNQAILCLSRALGAVASIIWARAVDIPVEHPKFQSTYTYMNSLSDVRNNNRKFKRAKVTYIQNRKNVPNFFSADP